MGNSLYAKSHSRECALTIKILASHWVTLSTFYVGLTGTVLNLIQKSTG